MVKWLWIGVDENRLQYPERKYFKNRWHQTCDTLR
jgi:hypothetical protein